MITTGAIVAFAIGVVAGGALGTLTGVVIMCLMRMAGEVDDRMDQEAAVRAARGGGP